MLLNGPTAISGVATAGVPGVNPNWPENNSAIGSSVALQAYPVQRWPMGGSSQFFWPRYAVAFMFAMN